eukprot:8857672-Heterocapsa_arctica.AAC.2
MKDVLCSPLARKAAAQRGTDDPEEVLGALLLTSTSYEPLLFAILEAAYDANTRREDISLL